MNKIREIIQEEITNILHKNHSVIYHGTPNKHDFNDIGHVYDGTFFSPNKNEASSYGEFVYKITLKSNRKNEGCFKLVTQQL
jgi:hypothetical protein